MDYIRQLTQVGRSPKTHAEDKKKKKSACARPGIASIGIQSQSGHVLVMESCVDRDYFAESIGEEQVREDPSILVI